MGYERSTKGFDSNEEKLEFFKRLYPEANYLDIRITWSRNRTRRLFLMGYKYCSNCIVMIRTDDLFCRNCHKKMRSNPRNNTALRRDSHPKEEPLTIAEKLFLGGVSFDK